MGVAGQWQHKVFPAHERGVSPQEVLPGHPQVKVINPWVSESWYALAFSLSFVEKMLFIQRLQITPKPSWMAPKGHDMAARLCPGHRSPRPPSTATQPQQGSHNGFPSIQNKHAITNLRLIDAICVSCLLGWRWKLPNSNGCHPWKPQGTYKFGPWRTSSAIPFLTLGLQVFLLPASLSILRLFVILKWVPSGRRLSGPLSLLWVQVFAVFN